mmetsp:Transcript_54754/g.146314  ORF Transcript_54754/g.146314 Transcript_54754/m.146314 type:complete len:206 (+) Transcript_54754:383-1000(+)
MQLQRTIISRHHMHDQQQKTPPGSVLPHRRHSQPEIWQSCVTSVTRRTIRTCETKHSRVQPSASGRRPVTDGRHSKAMQWYSSPRAKSSKPNRNSWSPPSTASVGSQSSSCASAPPPILEPDASPGNLPCGCPTVRLLPIGPYIRHALQDHTPGSQPCCIHEAPPLLPLPCWTSPPHRYVHYRGCCTPQGHTHQPKPSGPRGPIH